MGLGCQRPSCQLSAVSYQLLLICHPERSEGPAVSLRLSSRAKSRDLQFLSEGKRAGDGGSPRIHAGERVSILRRRFSAGAPMGRGQSRPYCGKSIPSDKSEVLCIRVFRGCGKTPALRRFASGHDFSRAEKPLYFSYRERTSVRERAEPSTFSAACLDGPFRHCYGFGLQPRWVAHISLGWEMWELRCFPFERSRIK